MRHLNSGRKLNRTASHRRALMSNMATSLIISDEKRIKTTEAKAKELRPYVEKLISRACKAQQMEGPAGLHARRVVARLIKSKQAVQELFDAIAPAMGDRPGGYTRVVKLGTRRGDGARTAIIELVDFAAERDGAYSSGRSKKSRQAAEESMIEQTIGSAVEAMENAGDAVEEAVEDITDTVEEVVEEVAEKVDEVVSDNDESNEESTDDSEEDKK